MESYYNKPYNTGVMARHELLEVIDDLSEHNRRLQTLVEQRTQERTEVEHRYAVLSSTAAELSRKLFDAGKERDVANQRADAEFKRYQQLFESHTSQAKTIEECQKEAPEFVQLKMEISSLRSENTESQKTIACLRQHVEALREDRDQEIKRRFAAEDRTSRAITQWGIAATQRDSYQDRLYLLKVFYHCALNKADKKLDLLSTKLMHARALIKHQAAQLEEQTEATRAWRVQSKWADERALRLAVYNKKYKAEACGSAVRLLTTAQDLIGEVLCGTREHINS